MRSTTQPASQQQLNPAKKQLKNKKQMQSDLLALYQSKSRYFRVFYDILEEDGTTKQDLNPNSYNLLQLDPSTEEPFFVPSSVSDSLLNQHSLGFSSLYESDIFKWFDSLTLCERVNALTCTSPFLSEVIANMKRAQDKKNGSVPIWFAQSNKKPNIQNYIMESSLSKLYQDQVEPEPATRSRYGHQYYLGSAGYSSKFGKYSEAAALGFSDFDGQLQKQDQVRFYPQFFDDLYFSRCMHFTEVQQRRINEPYKYYSQEALVRQVRFCDMYQYMDTISADFGLVADSKQFFDILSNCSDGNAFTSRCKFVMHQQLGVHLIESPFWFKPDKFNTLASWLASIMEENLWANYTYHEIMSSKSGHEKLMSALNLNKDSQKHSLDYLFDFKQLQVVKETQQLVSIKNLAESWMNSPTDKRNEITQSILLHKTIEEQRKMEKKRLKDIYIKRDYFVSDHSGEFIISDSETQYIIEKSLKVCNKQKTMQVHEFISELFLSPLSNIELPRDVINRHLLKLIIDLHQDMLIQELIGSNLQPNPQKKEKKRKKKKADKSNVVLIENPENKDTSEINNNIQVDQKMESQPPLKQKSFDQTSKHRQNQSKETLSYESFMMEKHSDTSLHTCKEPDNEASEGEQLIFKDSINDDADGLMEDPIDKELLRFDMHLVSDNYISSMLLRIEQEIKSNDDPNKFKVITDQTQKKNKKKKTKKQSVTKGEKDIVQQDSSPDKTFVVEALQIAETIKTQLQSQTLAKTAEAPFVLSSHVRQKTQQIDSNMEKDLIFRNVKGLVDGDQDRKQTNPKKNKKQKSILTKQTFDDEQVFEPGSAQPKLNEELILHNKMKVSSQIIVPDQTQNFNRMSHLNYQNQSANNSRMSSRQQSPVNTTGSVNNPGTNTDKSTQGRKRNRKKNKTILDPEEVMNQFILQLNSKKESEKKVTKPKTPFPKPVSKMQSRKTSEIRGGLNKDSKHASYVEESQQIFGAKPKNLKQGVQQQDLMAVVTELKPEIRHDPKNESNSVKTKSSKKQPVTLEVTVLDQETVTDNKANSTQSTQKKSGMKWAHALGDEVEVSKFDQNEKSKDQKASKKKGLAENILENELATVSAGLKPDRANQTVVQSKKYSSLVNETVSELTLNNKEDSVQHLSSYLMPSPQGLVEPSSKISTNSPSFQPKDKSSNAGVETKPSAEGSDLNLALSHQNTSLEKMSFNLSNIKSFNPNSAAFQKKQAKPPGNDGSSLEQPEGNPLHSHKPQQQSLGNQAYFAASPLAEQLRSPHTSVVNISEQLGLQHHLGGQPPRQRAQFGDFEYNMHASGYAQVPKPQPGDASHDVTRGMTDGPVYLQNELRNGQMRSEGTGLVNSMPAVPNANISSNFLRPQFNPMQTTTRPVPLQPEERKSKDQRQSNSGSNGSVEPGTTLSFQQRPAPPRPHGQDQLSQMSQMSSFNINVFGNLNIGQLVSPNQDSPKQDMHEMSQPEQMHLGNHLSGLVGVPLMNMQLGQVNNMQGPPSSQFMNINQSQNMYQSYQHQFYDYNLSQTIEFKFYEKFDNDIYDEVNGIQQRIDTTKEERNFVLDKLQKMCEQVFSEQNKQAQDETQGNDEEVKQVPLIMQFGSLMTGLALETSDMDMAVTNLFLPDRQKMIDCLDLFADYLRKWDIIKDLNAISTASIPVIKGNIDLRLLREKELAAVNQGEQQNVQMQDFGDCQNDVMPKESKRASSRDKEQLSNDLQYLKIDITFDDNMDPAKSSSLSTNQEAFVQDMPNPMLFNINQKTHQGLASSQLIKNYVEHYKCLKEVSIILKEFLARMDLNSPYHGGISSYSTVLLLVAYMNKWNLKMSSTLTPSRLLMGFLDYYSYYFNASLFGIDVSNNSSFYQLSSPESNFVILDPLNCQNNTTRNSFLTHEIIKSFRKAFNSLKNLLLHYQQTKSQDIQENLVDLILQRNQPPQQEGFIIPGGLPAQDVGFLPMHPTRYS